MWDFNYIKEGRYVIDSFIFGLFTLAYLTVLIWGLMKHPKTASAILFFVIIALIYDNGLLTFGHLIGEGQLLKTLSYGRFWLHALFTPTLILFSLFIMREAGIKFAQHTWAAFLFGGLMIIAIIVEYLLELKELQLKAQEMYGSLSYTSVDNGSGPPLMILIVVLALIFASIVLARSAKWWWMLLGTAVMTVGSALPFDVGSNVLPNALELFLMVMLMKTAIHFSKQVHSNNHH